MADADEALGEAELVEGLEKKKFSGKKLVIIGGAVVVLVIIVVLVLTLLGGGEEEEAPDPNGPDPELDRLSDEAAAQQQLDQAAQNQPQEELQLLFYPLESKQYNLNTGGEGSSFLRLKATLEIDRESYRADLDAKLPRILDEFNAYMRGLRPEDVDGGVGFFRIKEELLARINQAVAPTRVNDILFEEFLVQG